MNTQNSLDTGYVSHPGWKKKIYLNVCEFFVLLLQQKLTDIFFAILWLYCFLLKIGHIGKAVPEEGKNAC